ncbi:MAG: TrkH family potassium uptake protein [Johnsonella sp.]|nr:TrkH family potassium uptake protein [Johnsonella sp.]
MKEKGFVKKHFSQLQFIAFGFFIMILFGAVLLTLPFASRSGRSVGFLDALFTSTSAGCVTGLVVRDTSLGWSAFGQIIILLLIQTGGLGFISIGVFFSVLMRRKIGLRERGLLKESINSLEIGGVVKLAKKILFGTLLFEAAGAFLLSFRFIPDYGVFKGIWFSVFHSVSAFCNAGFDLLGASCGEYSSLSAYSKDILVNLVIMFLIIIGGIGFMVWDDLSRYRFAFRKYRLHSKIVLLTTGVLIALGSFVFLITERNGVLAQMGLQEKLLSCAFSAVTPRTAGFNTVDTAKLSNAGKLFTMILMFIGGSPGSTAGGIKTTTVFVLFMYIDRHIRQYPSVDVFGRRLADEAVKTSATIISINLFLVMAAGMMIASVESAGLTDIMFEVCSAMGTAGMSTGITRELSAFSKLVLVGLMYLGRVGSLSFALLFMQDKKPANIMQPKEEISVG